MVGVVHVIDLLQQSLRNEPLNLQVLIRQPLVFPETLPLLPHWSSFATPEPILPLLSMNLVPLKEL
jgi:CBS domain containing-hemolysin-like protein